MQAIQLKELLSKQTSMLRAAGAAQMATRVGRVATAFGRGGSQTVTKFIVAIDKSAPASETGEGGLLGELVETIQSLIALLNEAGAKKTVVTDVELVLDLVRQHGEVSISEFESAVERAVASASRGKAKPGAPAVDTKQLIEHYLQKLEAALGDDALFSVVYRELASDKQIGREAAVEISSRFFERMPSSTTRPKALQKILYRHEKLLESRDASSSIGGKAA